MNSPYCLCETREFRCDTAIPKLVETADAIGVPEISLFARPVTVPVVPVPPVPAAAALSAAD